MFETFTNSIEIVKQSFNVLRKDKEILMFPVLSGFFNILLFIGLVVVVFASLAVVDPESTTGAVFFLVLFAVYYIISYFIISFFNAGLVTCAGLRLNGKDPSFGDGLSTAFGKIIPVLVWSVISATIGMVLRTLTSSARKSKNPAAAIIGGILIALIGMAWSLMTLFVMQAIVFEDKGAISAIKRSSGIFIQTWGKNVVGRFSIGIIMFLVALLGLIPILAGLLIGDITILIGGALLSVLFWILLGLVSSALSSIFSTALYFYAVTGEVPQAFDSETIRNAYEKR